MSTEHLYLSIPRSHLSNAQAIKVTLETIREVVPGTATSTDAQLRRQTYTITSPAGETNARTFSELTAEARTDGSVRSLRIATDHDDPIFGGTYGIGVSEHLTIRTEYLGHAIEAKGPGHTYPVGRELVEDILFYRGEICANSSMQRLRTVGRLYRAYTLCCTTLVEAYLNRQLWYFKAIGRLTDEQVDSLPKNFEERMKAWLPLFTDKTISDLKAVKPCWGHLVELRNERNRFAHAPGPTAALSLHEVCRGLNSARTGIGGTLAKLREWQGLSPLGFIERLERAPEAQFVSALKRKSATKKSAKRS